MLFTILKIHECLIPRDERLAWSDLLGFFLSITTCSGIVLYVLIFLSSAAPNTSCIVRALYGPSDT